MMSASVVLELAMFRNEEIPSVTTLTRAICVNPPTLRVEPPSTSMVRWPPAAVRKSVPSPGSIVRKTWVPSKDIGAVRAHGARDRIRPAEWLVRCRPDVDEASGMHDSTCLDQDACSLRPGLSAPNCWLTFGNIWPPGMMTKVRSPGSEIGASSLMSTRPSMNILIALRARLLIGQPPTEPVEPRA